MAKSHPAGMRICYATFAGISLRLCCISLRSFRFGYAAFRFAHFASVMLHFASLISHNLRCIPAYAHQIPKGFFQSLLNNHRDNLYIISFDFGEGGGWNWGGGVERFGGGDAAVESDCAVYF